MTNISQQFTDEFSLPLPANYLPNYIKVLLNGQEAFEIEDGEVYLHPIWDGNLTAEPELLEIHWDDQLVYAQNANQVLINRLSLIIGDTSPLQWLEKNYSSNSNEQQL